MGNLMVLSHTAQQQCLCITSPLTITMEHGHTFRLERMVEQMDTYDVHKGVDRVVLGMDMRRGEVAPTSVLKEQCPQQHQVSPQQHQVSGHLLS
jgi:hypothetical protein